VAEHPQPVRSGKQPDDRCRRPGHHGPAHVRAVHQRPDASYERFIERRLREELGFVGTPIVLAHMVRGEAHVTPGNSLRGPASAR
jgi:GTP-binding protein